MAMNFENNTVNFSTITDEDKENFMKSCIEKQLNLAKFMAFIYDDSNILHDHAILKEMPAPTPPRREEKVTTQLSLLRMKNFLVKIARRNWMR